MSGLALTLLLSTSPVEAPQALELTTLADRLQSCGATSQADAVRCLRRTMPEMIRRIVVDREQPEYGGDDDLTDALVEGFRLEGSNRLRASFTRQGLPEETRATLLAELILEEVWLAEKGCRYDRSEWMGIAREKAEWRLAFSRHFAGDIGTPATHYPKDLQVTCRSWKENGR